jgi:hypothetical protein
LLTHKPTIGARLSIYETGTRQPDLESVLAVVFLLGDPLEELYPRCYADAMGIYERACALRIPTVNPPPVLARYRKRDQSRKWSALGLPTPPGHAYDTFDGLMAILGSQQFPVLVRADSEHCMAGIVMVRDAKRAARLCPEEVPTPGIVTPMVDVRRGYPKTGPDRIWSKLYHKKRVYVLGQEVFPDSLYFSTEPTVCLDTSMFGRLRQRRQLAKRFVRPLPLRHLCAHVADRQCWAPDIFRCEREFYQGAVEQASLFRSAAAALGLGWVALDYATLSDGTTILWEANPYPHIPPLAKGLLAGRRRLPERASLQLQAFGRFFEGFMRGPEYDFSGDLGSYLTAASAAVAGTRRSVA